MATVRITIDGTVWLDGDLGNWQQSDPKQIMTRLQPGAKREPWFVAAMTALSDAATTNTPATIDVTTRPTGWTLRVDGDGVIDAEVVDG